MASGGRPMKNTGASDLLNIRGCRKHGVLRKKEHVIKLFNKTKWDSTYVILRADYLYIYQNDQSTKPKHVHDLMLFDSVRPMFSNDSYSFFEIKFRDSTQDPLQFRCMTDEERNNWITVILQAKTDREKASVDSGVSMRSLASTTSFLSLRSDVDSGNFDGLPNPRDSGYTKIPEGDIETEVIGEETYCKPVQRKLAINSPSPPSVGPQSPDGQSRQDNATSMLEGRPSIGEGGLDSGFLNIQGSQVSRSMTLPVQESLPTNSTLRHQILTDRDREETFVKQSGSPRAVNDDCDNYMNIDPLRKTHSLPSRQCSFESDDLGAMYENVQMGTASKFAKAMYFVEHAHTQSDIRRLLANKPDGTFCVYENVEHEKVFAVVIKGQCKFSRIKERDGSVYLCEEYKFSSLDLLLNHYSDNPLRFQELSVKVTKPINGS